MIVVISNAILPIKCMIGPVVQSHIALAQKMHDSTTGTWLGVLEFQAFTFKGERITHFEM